ncbi:hypothetical protein, partial [Escherichia albertii]
MTCRIHFGTKSISTIAESKRFPLHEMRED